MKESKILHINDGKPEVLSNGNFMLVEEYARASKILNQYLADGWEIQTMIPEYTPNPTHNGPAFYRAGFTVCLVRNVD